MRAKMPTGLCTPFPTAVSGEMGKKQIDSIVPVPNLGLLQVRHLTRQKLWGFRALGETQEHIRFACVKGNCEFLREERVDGWSKVWAPQKRQRLRNSGHVYVKGGLKEGWTAEKTGDVTFFCNLEVMGRDLFALPQKKTKGFWGKWK